ncbi:MAG TPA: VWA domain-containing protein [Thermoanaerobaculia bacterium]|nr:VWA domain-containing protein [Thermoanaerobaculia bacterium]
MSALASLRTITPFVVALTLAQAAASGQSKAQEPIKDRFEDVSGVVSVEVPVNVVGRDGSPVRGLTRKDFEVLDGGKKQEISGFEVIDLSLVASATDTAARARAEQLNAPSRRHFLLLFDLSFSSVPALLKARLAAREFVLHSLAPTDLAAVATLSLEHGPRLVVTFTTDRAQLARGLDTLGSRTQLANERYDPLRFVIEAPEASSVSAGSGGQGRTPDLRDDRTGGALGDYLASLSVMGQKDERLFNAGRVVSFSRALASVAKTLKGLKGRKQVIFFSEGFDSRLMLGREASRTEEQREEADDLASGRQWMTDLDNRYGNTELQNEINRTLDEFRRSDCVIQAVDIGGLRATGAGAAAGAGNAGAGGTGKEALFFMANETGGELYEDANNLSQQLEKLLDRTSVTYLLVFERSDLKEDGAYHRLKVRADLPPGARLSHRAGYFAPRPFRDLDPLEKNLLAAEGIAAAAPRRDLDLHVLTTSFRASGDQSYVPVIVEIGGARLLEGQSGDNLGLEIYTYVTDEKGQMRDFFTQQVGFSLAKGREAIRKTGIKYYGHLELPPGSYRVRVLARNSETGRTGVESAALEIPTYSKSRPELLPPFFIEAPGTWFLIRERSQEQERSVVYPFTVKGEPYVPAARPQLAPEQSSKLCLVAYNLGTGDLAVRGQVVDPQGNLVDGGVFELVERTATGITGLDKLIATFRPHGLKAGGYVLKVAVSNPATGAAETNSLPFVVN